PNVTFSANGTNAAKNTTATFTMGGSYLLEVSITDPNGYTVASFLPVVVSQTLSSVAVAAPLPDVSPNGVDQLSATALDQFGNAMTSQPTFAWSVTNGGGSVSASGLYTAPPTGTSATVEASTGNISGTSQLSIVNQPPLIANSAGASASPAIVTTGSSTLGIAAVDDGGPSNLSYLWSATTIPAGAPEPTYSVNGTNAASLTAVALYAPGTYLFTVTVTDAGELSTTSQVPVTFDLASDAWTGSQSSAWSDPFNWSATAIPGAATSVTINGGTPVLTSPANIGGLTIDGGSLDVTDTTLTINDAVDPIAAIQSYIQSGYAGGAWNGVGIISSSVAAANAAGELYGVGYADGADGIVGGLTSGQIEIRPTLLGDATLSGGVTFGDFQILAQYFGSTGSWDQGNWNYGTNVEFGDFQLLAANFGKSASLGAQTATSGLQSAAINSFPTARTTPSVIFSAVNADNAILDGLVGVSEWLSFSEVSLDLI
ncbi:MAG TPA: hypothetical protein VMD30_10445, partial [Tepidisphaeraceae bacterium]|nr:hypothetical protein [Tepidisphaeraceae bacterium]